VEANDSSYASAGATQISDYPCNKGGKKMAQGPILIFDKSTPQGLNPNQANWMDNFFMSNITPLFYIETLADLEKEVKAGKTPEQVVGEIAYKTPDMQAHPKSLPRDAHLGRPHG
jgi:hypothetical protein